MTGQSEVYEFYWNDNVAEQSEVGSVGTVAPRGMKAFYFIFL